VFFLACIILFIIFSLEMSYLADKKEMMYKMNSTLMKYQGELKTDPNSMSWNLVQIKYSICGYLGPTDYESTNWFKYRPAAKKYQIAPYTCCQGLQQVYGVQLLRYGAWPEKVFPMVRMTKDANNFVDDCYKHMGNQLYPAGGLDIIYDDLTHDFTSNYTLYGLVAGILACHFIILIITIAACCTHRKAAKIVAADMTRQQMEARRRQKERAEAARAAREASRNR